MDILVFAKPEDKEEKVATESDSYFEDMEKANKLKAEKLAKMRQENNAKIKQALRLKAKGKTS